MKSKTGALFNGYFVCPSSLSCPFSSFIMGNIAVSTGQPWRYPEDKVLRDTAVEPDFIPPPIHHAVKNTDPLYKPPAHVDSAHEAQVRAAKMDCLSDSISFAAMPAAVGMGWGAMKAAVLAKPNLRELNRHIGSGVSIGVKGILRELAYLKNPVLFLGGYAALYAYTNCTLAKWRGYDGVLNTSVAAGITGIALGIYCKPLIRGLY
jgi:hypothetical protein